MVTSRGSCIGIERFSEIWISYLHQTSLFFPGLDFCRVLTSLSAQQSKAKQNKTKQPVYPRKKMSSSYDFSFKSLKAKRAIVEGKGKKRVKWV
jgi:hypothetical protein